MAGRSALRGPEADHSSRSYGSSRRRAATCPRFCGAMAPGRWRSRRRRRARGGEGGAGDGQRRRPLHHLTLYPRPSRQRPRGPCRRSLAVVARRRTVAAGLVAPRRIPGDGSRRVRPPAPRRRHRRPRRLRRLHPRRRRARHPSPPAPGVLPLAVVAGARGRRRGRRLGRIEPGLLHRPGIAGGLVALLLFRRLALGGVDVLLRVHGGDACRREGDIQAMRRSMAISSGAMREVDGRIVRRAGATGNCTLVRSPPSAAAAL